MSSDTPHLSTCSSTPSLARARRSREPLSRLLLPLALALPLSSALMGCESKPPLTMQGGPLDAGVDDKKAAPDLEPHDPVPEAAVDLFEDLPFPPRYLLRKPGDAVSNLRAQLPQLQEMYSPRFLSVSYTDTPFQTVVYMLDESLRTVEAVAATFQPEYTQKIEHKHLIDALKERLGKPETFSDNTYNGHRWTNLDYRIDLRVDRRVKDIEVLFHLRGAETLERTKRGLIKKKRGDQ